MATRADAEVSVKATPACLPLPTDTGAGLAGLVLKFTPAGPTTPTEKSPGMR